MSYLLRSIDSLERFLTIETVCRKDGFLQNNGALIQRHPHRQHVHRPRPNNPQVSQDPRGVAVRHVQHAQLRAVRGRVHPDIRRRDARFGRADDRSGGLAAGLPAAIRQRYHYARASIILSRPLV